MANIKLIDAQGDERTYNGVVKVKIPLADGTGNATFHEGGEDSPLPPEISTEAEMTALLETAEIGSIYKYTGTSGTYENGAYYRVDPILITFAIDDVRYQAEQGMTWAEWVANTTYNTDGYYIGKDATDGNSYVYVNQDGRLRIEDVVDIYAPIVEETWYELIWDLISEIETNIISFTIDGTTYQAESGMTWGEWCDSEYNTSTYYVSENLGGWIMLDSTTWVVPPNGNYNHVYDTDVIISGGAYPLYYD